VMEEAMALRWVCIETISHRRKEMLLKQGTRAATR